MGRQRGAGLGGSNDEREQTLNQILVEMDGFDVNTNIIIMAATNRPDILDVALLRPGRFDRRIILDEPSLKDREAVLKEVRNLRDFQGVLGVINFDARGDAIGKSIGIFKVENGKFKFLEEIHPKP